MKFDFNFFFQITSTLAGNCLPNDQHRKPASVAFFLDLRFERKSARAPLRPSSFCELAFRGLANKGPTLLSKIATLDLGSGLCIVSYPKSPTSAFAPTLCPRCSTSGTAASLPEVLDLGSGLCTDFCSKCPTSAFAPSLCPRFRSSAPAVSLP